MKKVKPDMVSIKISTVCAVCGCPIYEVGRPEKDVIKFYCPTCDENYLEKQDSSSFSFELPVDYKP